MSAQIIDGKSKANELIDCFAKEVNQFKMDGKRLPGLAVILVGEHPASKVYVANKERACDRAGIAHLCINLPETIKEEELLAEIQKLSDDAKIDGILVQLPLPKHINTQNIIESIPPHKDVDGFHPYNIGRLAVRLPSLRPCTPQGIIHLLKQLPIELRGIQATIVGASNIVGRPLALELLLEGATVTVCHRFTKDLNAQVAAADLLIVAVGIPNLVDGLHVKPGATVIDVGINRLKDGSLCGDVNFTKASERAAYITPVPGGVGPMTVAMLLKNTLQAYKEKI